VQLTTDRRRPDALAFYERCGYAYAGASTYRYRDDVHATRVYAKRLPAEKP
jgi:hypothetical protein